MNRIFIYVVSEWFTKYVGDNLELIYDGYIEEETKGLGTVQLLRNDAQVINVMLRSSLKWRYCYTAKYESRKCKMSKERSGSGKVNCSF